MRKTMFTMMLACFFTTSMVAQTNENTKIKVTNIPTASGKILLMTDKGQQSMADDKEKETIIEMKKLPAGKYKFNVIHDVNGNWTLDMDEKKVPIESCASMEVEITEETQLITIELKDYQSWKKEN